MSASSLVVSLGKAVKGLSIKDVRSQEEGFVQCGHFSNKEEGFLQMQTFALFCVYKFGFSKFMMCPHRQRGRQCGHFSDKRGQLFAILYGHLLWMVPNEIASSFEWLENGSNRW